jgi:hypothetical protein
MGLLLEKGFNPFKRNLDGWAAREMGERMVEAQHVHPFEASKAESEIFSVLRAYEARWREEGKPEVDGYESESEDEDEAEDE